jgi:hypothetical protein
MTTTDLLAAYREVWSVDSEFGSRPGERPAPRCLVAVEWRTGRVVELWLDDGDAPPRPPYPLDDGVLFVAFAAQAELAVHLKLGWDLPRRVVDLCAEFRCLTNGLALPSKSLIGALQYFGLPAMEATVKDGLRGLALRGGPYTPDERQELVRYCRADAQATADLLTRMLPQVDLTAGLIRGRFTHAVARMESEGVPIDLETWQLLCDHWDEIRTRLVRRVNPKFGVYVPVSPRRPDGPFKFSLAKFEEWVNRLRIPWPRTPKNRLSVSDKTFKDMAALLGGEVNELRELRNTLNDLKLVDLAVGRDGRNRTPLWPFSTKTMRNAPSSTKYIFGATKWIRSLVRPPEGFGVAYIDWSRQEPGIAAVLSGDEAMLRAYRDGDYYLGLAQACGMAPRNATAESHPFVRDRFKVVALATMYGMEDRGLAAKLGIPRVYAREILNSHRSAFPAFWEWAERAVANAFAGRVMRTAFGWERRLGSGVSDRSVRNWPIQSTGSHLMQYAAMYATEAGLAVAGPVHDAFLLVAAEDRLAADVAAMRGCMDRASRLILDGFTLKTDVAVVRHPDRYEDKRGLGMWRTVQQLSAEIVTTPHHRRATASP